MRETLDWDRLQTLLVILSFKHIPSLTLLQFSHLKLIAKNENKKTNKLPFKGGWVVLFSYFLVLPAVCRALLNAFQEINVHLFDKVSFYSFFKVLVLAAIF